MNGRRPSRRAPRLLPTGDCWCGCGTEVPRGSFFAPGHDKKAESRIIREVYGGVAEFVAAHRKPAPGKRAAMRLPPPLPEGEAARNKWRKAIFSQAAARITEDMKRLQALGIVDADGNLLKTELPPDMRPGSETGV